MEMVESLVYPALSLGGLGLFFGLLLGFAAKKFAVKIDPRVAKIREALPGANCGGCGYAGCDAYASAVVSGEASPAKCTAGGAEVAQKIAAILGVEVGHFVRKVAFVKCAGSKEKAKEISLYEGVLDCRKATIVPGGGTKACKNGCLGFGSCVAACAFDAIYMENGVAKVDERLCTGCGACASVCPRNVITLIPATQDIRVMCNSTQKGVGVKNVCEAGCIGCGLCAKMCPSQAITMKDNLPVINPDLCTGCQVCAMKCPVGAISVPVNEKARQMAG
jgi:Na+-translocating ferredoxin:NAD+ oxidoreductase RNF subunit RnfB